MEFGQFHPTKSRKSVQDIGLLILGSRAEAVYSKASELLSHPILRHILQEKGYAPMQFKAHDLDQLVHSFEDEVSVVSEVLGLDPGKTEVVKIYDVLTSIKYASLAIFRNLQTLLVEEESGKTVTVQGYVPVRSIKEFQQLLKDYPVKIEQLDKDEAAAPTTPSLVVNRRGISIFEELALQRGVPKYNEIDPTPMVALVFPLFFGIMFGDVGHGVTLLVFGWYLVSKTKYAYWGKLLAALGSSALVVGIFRGSFFGIDFSSPIRGLIPFPQALTAGFTLQNIPLILEIAIVVGTFHLGSAYAISFINEMRSRNYLDAFLNRMATLILYCSIIPFGLAVAGTGLQIGSLFTSGASTPFFYELLGLHIPVSALASGSIPFILASLVVLIVSHPLIEYRSSRSVEKSIKSVGLGLLEGVTKPFEFFTNVLSYVRLGVLLVTTYVLGSLVAGVLAFGVLGGLLAAFLNMVVIAMEGLIVYVQDMRLHLYEWLSKFYIGSGVAFTPLISSGESFKITSHEDIPLIVKAS